MAPNVKVCINGFVLGSMLYDCANDLTEQEGFLFGTVTRNVRDEINDHSLTGTQEEIFISICSSMHFGNILSFYNATGHLKKDELENGLQDRKKVLLHANNHVIGWYRYRRYSSLYPSLRETAVHQKLKQFFEADMPSGPKYFVYAVFSSSNLPNFATHSYDYAFFTQKQNHTFKNINVHVLNLGDTKNSYRAGSMCLPFINSPSFNSVVCDYMNLQSFHKLEDNIQAFHLSLRSKLASLQEELAASDAVNASLETDIERLSNEMQSLLATQEQQFLSNQSTPASLPATASVSTKSEVRSSTGSKAGPSSASTVSTSTKGGPSKSSKASSTAPKTGSSAASKTGPSNASKTGPSTSSKTGSSTVSTTFKAGPSKEAPSAASKVDPSATEAGPSTATTACPSDKDFKSPLKRSALDVLVPEVSQKRVCLDKYFDSEEQEINMPGSNLENVVISKITTSKSKEEVTNSRLMVVDPDNGETSSISQNEKKKSHTSEDINNVNMVSSACNVVEVVISDAGSQTYNVQEKGFTDVKEPEKMKEQKETKETKDSSKSPNSIEAAITVAVAGVNSDKVLPTNAKETVPADKVLPVDTKEVGRVTDAEAVSVSMDANEVVISQNSKVAAMGTDVKKVPSAYAKEGVSVKAKKATSTEADDVIKASSKVTTDAKILSDDYKLDAPIPAVPVPVSSKSELQKKINSPEFKSMPQGNFPSQICKTDNLHSQEIKKKTSTPFIVYAKKESIDKSKNNSASATPGNFLKKDEPPE